MILNRNFRYSIYQFFVHNFFLILLPVLKVCICKLLFCLCFGFLMSVIIIFISRHRVVLFMYLWFCVMVSLIPPLGFCSGSAGSLHSELKRTWPDVLQEDCFLLLYFTQDCIQDREHLHLPSLGQDFFTLPFRDSRFIHCSQNRFPLIHISGLSPSLGQQGPVDDWEANTDSSTH